MLGFPVYAEICDQVAGMADEIQKHLDVDVVIISCLTETVLNCSKATHPDLELSRQMKVVSASVSGIVREVPGIKVFISAPLPMKGDQSYTEASEKALVS